MKNPFKAIEDQGIAPVISIKDSLKAVPLSRALLAGGISNIEITLRTPAALQAIENIKNELPEMTVSAGTVLTKQNVDDAMHAGADYVVTPGYSDEIVAYALERGTAVIPGCVTASEVDRGIRAGLKYLKFFPAESLGGIKAINLLCGPYKGIKFLPTGGMTFDNIGSYLSSKNIVACGGSYMAPSSLIDGENWDAVTANSIRAMDISLGFSLAHVGLNHEDPVEAEKNCRRIAKIFRLPYNPGISSDFSGTAVECMKKKYYGTNGHIGFKTNSCERARAYFESIGLSVISDSVKTDSSGNLQCFYLNEEIGGFAVHVF